MACKCYRPMSSEAPGPETTPLRRWRGEACQVWSHSVAGGGTKRRRWGNKASQVGEQSVAGPLKVASLRRYSAFCGLWRRRRKQKCGPATERPLACDGTGVDPRRSGHGMRRIGVRGACPPPDQYRGRGPQLLGYFRRELALGENVLKGVGGAGVSEANGVPPDPYPPHSGEGEAKKPAPGGGRFVDRRPGKGAVGPGG